MTRFDWLASARQTVASFEISTSPFLLLYLLGRLLVPLSRWKAAVLFT